MKQKDDIDKERILQFALKRLQKQADDVVLMMGDSQHDLVKFSNNKISVTKSWSNNDLLVFISIKKRRVITSIKEFSKKGIETSAKKIISFAENITPNTEYKGIAKGPFKYEEIEDTYDPKILSLEDKGIDLVEKGINKALSSGGERTAGIFEKEHSNTLLLTSNGCEGKDKGTNVYFSIRTLNGKEASGHKVAVSRMLNKINVERTAENAAIIAAQAKNPKKGIPGIYDVVFDPLPIANLIQNFGNAFSILNIESSLSCIKGKLNKKAVSQNITIIDDGTLPNGCLSSKFDAEGTPSKRNILVDKGVVKSYLHNTSTAKRYNTESTGNAGLIAPELRNLILQKGNHSFNELTSMIKKGLYITNTWYTRFQNYEIGDFSTIPRDGIFYIENGKIKYPVKNIRISENLLKMMNKVVAVGNNPEQIRSWEVESPVISPCVLIKKVNITMPIEESHRTSI